MRDVFEDWCGDPRPLTFAEFLDERWGSLLSSSSDVSRESSSDSASGRRARILFWSPAHRPAPDVLARWAHARGLMIVPAPNVTEVEHSVLRSYAVLVVVDDQEAGVPGLELCSRLKADPYSAITPVAVFASNHTTGRVQEWFAAGADEVITPLFESDEQAARLDGLIFRTAQCVGVSPSTLLPGTVEIEREIRRRMRNGGELFAVCRADLNHLYEYNNSYSHYDGDRVVYILSRILRDVVKGMLGSKGFVGHSGGDDFVVVIPVESIGAVCSEVLDVFDTLIPYQYNEKDRQAGYCLGKDRRGQMYHAPLMTLSFGVVTNEERKFVHPAQIAELAQEMLSYAKFQPGSVFVVDRRVDPSERGSTR